MPLIIGNGAIFKIGDKPEPLTIGQALRRLHALQDSIERLHEHCRHREPEIYPTESVDSTEWIEPDELPYMPVPWPNILEILKLIPQIDSPPHPE